ncbi:MAG: copper amine oxidase N-terminal domain-containing protein [Clostridiales bacterium]|nr:copper amine oxidase N-terminal domain-containing protein [Clostridiales bacterium]
MNKKILAVVIVLVVLASGLVVNADSLLKIFIDGEEINTEAKLENGRTIASVRDIAEALGASVEWDASSNSVIIKSNGKSDEMRVSLLEQALIPDDPVTAVTSWAEGIKMRNGALQYALLSPELKKEKYDEYADLNWVTGTSSPWVKEYNITEKGKTEGVVVYQIEYVYTDSTQSILKIYEEITVGKSDMGWQVISIDRVDIYGKITEVNLNEDGSVKGIFVEGEENSIGSYDKGTVMIDEDTKIYKGYTFEEYKPEDLKEGMEVIATYTDGPMIMIYPPQGLGKTIRVLN